MPTCAAGYETGLPVAEIASAARARKLRLTTYDRRWTTTDDEGLRRLVTLRSPPELAVMLGRTPEAVRRRARTLGLATVPLTARCARGRPVDR